jgi:hypothetical protein
LLISATIFAQAPEKLSYQAVVRDATGTLVTSQSVGIRVSIIQGGETGSAVYVETHTANTNANGLVSIMIGGGSIVSGSFAAIIWSTGPYFVKTETDPAGGANYTITGTSQLLSVPYTLYAKKANETDPIFGASVAGEITGTDITNWNNKLSSYTETDPTWEGTVDQTGNIGRTGNVGIGITTPSALLHTYGTGTGEGNVLFTGSYKTTSPGDPPTSGAGTRMMWYPDKAAFRAGKVVNVNWNKDSIGDYSVAMGYNTKAKGNYSTAMGNQTAASGSYSTAMGSFTTASGSYSTAMGYLTNASGSASTSIGYVTTALGSYSTAMGYQTNASGDNSTSMGSSTNASGLNSTAMGSSTNASGITSTAMGSSTNASGNFSTAMGRNANAVGSYSFAINLSNTSGPDVGANTFYVSGAAGIGGNRAWENWSDQRLKKDIQTLNTENNLAKIIQLNGVRFRWKDNDSRLNLGFIAQEVKDIIPESVRYDELNDIYSMEYTAIIPVLVQGIKEQQEVIEKQQSENEKQQSEIKSLQQQINELRELIKNK